MIYGTKGTMISEGGNFKLRYLDPEVELPKVVSDPSTPMGGFGNPEKLPWKEELVPIKGRRHSAHLGRSLRHDKTREGIPCKAR